MSKDGIKQNLETRKVPIVTILGHVDHGKTSILDYIRRANVHGYEAGGITQKISVFSVALNEDSSKNITFVDTPGHEAFDLMRSRGGNIADIVVLVVAANDGVKPQTIESIEIIKKSTAKPIVAINKVDLPDIDIAKIKRDLVNHGLLLEGMGGDVPVVEISAKTGKGIPELLDLISLVAEVEGLQERGNLPKGIAAKAFVLESVKDKSRGNVSTLILTAGNLCRGSWLGYKVGDTFVIERVKGIVSEEGKNESDLVCGFGGKVIGISQLIPVGSDVYILEKDDKKLLSSMYEKEVYENDVPLSEDNFFDDVFSAQQKEEDGNYLNVILKSSSEGSLQALEKSLGRLENDGYTVKIVFCGVGDVTQQDVELAKLSKSILLGFEVGIQKGVEDIASKNGVLVRTYSVIYKLIEEVEGALDMVSSPDETEEEIGNAIIKMIIQLTDGSVVLGCRVKDGILKRDCKAYVVRNDEILGEGNIKSLRINKSIVTEVKQGEECGVILNNTEVQASEGDELYCYKSVR